MLAITSHIYGRVGSNAYANLATGSSLPPGTQIRDVDFFMGFSSLEEVRKAGKDLALPWCEFMMVNVTRGYSLVESYHYTEKQGLHVHGRDCPPAELEPFIKELKLPLSEYGCWIHVKAVIEGKCSEMIPFGLALASSRYFSRREFKIYSDEPFILHMCEKAGIDTIDAFPAAMENAYTESDICDTIEAIPPPQDPDEWKTVEFGPRDGEEYLESVKDFASGENPFDCALFGDNAPDAYTAMGCVKEYIESSIGGDVGKLPKFLENFGLEGKGRWVGREYLLSMTPA